ncbi:hypothetical protein [Acinetobacter sp. YH12245]|uniref:hypothetical protein n=1 Tax=Acinetobacter sp. YH12245 TaxID=2601171 RepID=UPI0035A133C0
MMDIEKLKAEFEQSECFKRLEHVAQYTFFEFGAYIKRTDVPADIEKKCGKLITALLFSWSAWKEAKAQVVPEGYVLMPIKPTETMVMAVVKEHEGDAFLPYSLYDAYVKQAMIEAQEPANEL